MKPILVFLIGSSALMAQSDDRIWSGVYTSVQAERGKTAFVKSCSNCHNTTLEGTARAPALHGDRFIANWLNSNLYTLFIKLRDTMPATYPETVSDATKLDILAYLLQANLFPMGSVELKLDEKDLTNIRIARQGARDIPNFALVQVTGCLSQGLGASWVLTMAGEPAVVADENSAEAKTGPLGTLTYRLVSVAAFNPAAYRGEKVEVRGLLYREIRENRINLTSLRTVSKEACNSGPN